MGLAIEIADVTFAYGRAAPQLNAVSLQVPEGAICCLLGPNGAGKTTLLRCVLGLLSPREGSIRIGGTDIGDLSQRELSRRVAYVPQSTSTPFPFSALDIVVMGRTPHLSLSSSPSPSDRRAAMSVMSEFGIARLAARPFSVLSGGERRLVLMARAVVQDAPTMILDEPTSALDFGNESIVLEHVMSFAAAGRTVLMTTHQPSHALVCRDQAVLFRDGHVVADGPAREVVTSAHLSDLYAVEVRVLTAAAEADDVSELYACAPAVRTGRVMRELSFTERKHH